MDADILQPKRRDPRRGLDSERLAALERNDLRSQSAREARRSSRIRFRFPDAWRPLQSSAAIIAATMEGGGAV